MENDGTDGSVRNFLKIRNLNDLRFFFLLKLYLTERAGAQAGEWETERGAGAGRAPRTLPATCAEADASPAEPRVPHDIRMFRRVMSVTVRHITGLWRGVPDSPSPRVGVSAVFQAARREEGRVEPGNRQLPKAPAAGHTPPGETKSRRAART